MQAFHVFNHSEVGIQTRQFTLMFELPENHARSAVKTSSSAYTDTWISMTFMGVIWKRNNILFSGYKWRYILLVLAIWILSRTSLCNVARSSCSCWSLNMAETHFREVSDGRSRNLWLEFFVLYLPGEICHLKTCYTHYNLTTQKRDRCYFSRTPMVSCECQSVCLITDLAFVYLLVYSTTFSLMSGFYSMKWNSDCEWKTGKDV
jgi:hypothetical protein